jgi:hypothetical protein
MNLARLLQLISSQSLAILNIAAIVCKSSVDGLTTFGVFAVGDKQSSFDRQLLQAYDPVLLLDLKEITINSPTWP